MIINTAKRLESVKEYYFSRKLREIAQLNADGQDIINLGIGSPDMAPSEEARELLGAQAVKADGHGYQSYKGLPALRTAMAAFYQKFYGVTLDADSEVLPLMGSKEGIMHLSMAFLDKGDVVLVPDPGYPTYTSVSRLVEANVQTYDLLESNNWLPDLKALEQTDLSAVKIMWINYPNMPTGTNASKRLFEELVAFAERNQILLINDNPYSLVLNDNPMSILSIEGAKEVALELNSLSKSHNLAGWRVGMLMGGSDYISAVLKVKSNMDSGMFKGIQMGAIAALEQPNSWHNERNAVYTKRLYFAHEIMKELNCYVGENQSGMFLWAKIPDWAKSGEAFSEYILDNSRVFITPGFIFGKNGDRYIRIALCSSEKTLEEAFNRIRLLFAIA